MSAHPFRSIRHELPLWRSSRDLNPGWVLSPLPVFKTGPFNHLGTAPGKEKSLLNQEACFL